MCCTSDCQARSPLSVSNCPAASSSGNLKGSANEVAPSIVARARFCWVWRVYFLGLQVRYQVSLPVQELAE